MKNGFLLSYSSLNQDLVKCGTTAAELHGILCGVLCGNKSQKQNWELIYDLMNEGQPYTGTLSQQLVELYRMSQSALEEAEFSMQLLLPSDEEEMIVRCEALSLWVSSFLLGLNLVQKEQTFFSESLREGLRDLNSIAQLGFDDSDDDDDENELEHALSEVTEYARVILMMCYQELHYGCSGHNAGAQAFKLH